MPAIRALCKTFKKPEAAPHVFAGVSSVLKAHRTNADELELQHTPSRKRKRPSGTVGAPITNVCIGEEHITALDRKSTRLNSSHTVISYAVFCLKKKKIKE